MGEDIKALLSEKWPLFLQIIHKHFILIFLLFFTSGIIFYNTYWAQLLLGFALFIIFIILIFKKQRASSLFLILYILAILFGSFYTKYKLNITNLSEYLNHRVNISLYVLEEPEIKNNRVKFLAYWPQKRARLLVSYKLNQANKSLHYGNEVFCEGIFTMPLPPTNPGQFDYPKYLHKKGISGIFKAKKIIIKNTKGGNIVRKLAYKLKNKILEITRKTLPYPYSDLYVGLVFGDHGTDLPEEWQESFQRLGLTHLLVVSGAQVALLSGIMLAIFRAFSLSNGITFSFITIINIIFYFLTGGGASIFRAILMAELLLALKFMKRNPDFYHVFAFTGLIMLLINPLNIHNVGAQLSFMATFALVFAASKITEILPEKWPSILKESFSVSFTPFIFTLPIIWVYFNQLSTLALISNMLVISLIELLVTLGFFSTLIGFIFLPLTQLINNFCLLIMIIMEKGVSFFSNLSFAQINIKAPHISVIIIFYMLIFMVFTAVKKKNTKKIYILSGIIFSLFLVLIIPSFFPKKYLKVTFLDVGQGDSVLIETPRRHTLLIDAGNRIIDFRTGKVIIDMGKRVVMPVLKYKGINKLDLVFISHFDSDHVGGIPYLLKRLIIGTIFDNGRYKKNCFEYYEVIKEKKLSRLQAIKDNVFHLEKDLDLAILYPKKNDQGESENNRSVVLKLTYKKIDFLLTGDLEHEKEEVLVREYGNYLESEILKNGHHGSKSSTCPIFLKTVNPLYSVISVGRKNRYHHPHPSVIERLKKYGSAILRTDTNGAIEFKTDGQNIFYKTFSN